MSPGLLVCITTRPAVSIHIYCTNRVVSIKLQEADGGYGLLLSECNVIAINSTIILYTINPYNA